MNVNNGEILAMVDVPEFNLNEPFVLIDEFTALAEQTDENGKKRVHGNNRRSWKLRI